MLEIDLGQLLPDEVMQVLTQDFLEVLLDDLAASARVKWIRLAQVGLRSTAQTYIEGIQEVEAAPSQRTIVLTGWLANALENGADPWDLRETLLGPEAKHRKPGFSHIPGQPKFRDGSWYAHIPFRHGTPGTTGLAGQPMGMRYGPQGEKSRAWAASGHMTEGEAAAMGKKIYELAKALKQRRAGKRKASIRDVLGAGAGDAPLLAPWHKTDIYAGMRKERKTYVGPSGKQTTQSQYTTFRTISTRNDVGWIHPGFEPRHYSQQVAEHVARIAPGAVDAAIKRAMKGHE